MSTPRNTREAQRDMSTPRDTREALSDITNVIDEASRRREERNMQQRKRRADMSIEQRDEINRKQCEYRERKKAATQNSSTSVALPDTVLLTSAPTGIDENADPHDENTPIILDNDNMQTDADGKHTHVGVGLSRGVSRSTTRILAKPKEDLDPTGKSTKNIVYKDVLNW